MNITINEMQGSEKQNAYAADIITREVERMAGMTPVTAWHCIAGYLDDHAEIEVDRRALVQWIAGNLVKADKSGMLEDKLAELVERYTAMATCREIIDNGCMAANAAVVRVYLAAQH